MKEDRRHAASQVAIQKSVTISYIKNYRRARRPAKAPERRSALGSHENCHLARKLLAYG